MRLELDIEDELFRRMEAEALQVGTTVESIFQQYVRCGLQQLKANASKSGYRCPTFPMGWPAELDVNKAIQLAAELEDEELSRQLAN